MLKYLPIDLSTFSTMITGNYLYIDKTEYIYNLFSRGSRLYFLSRPRRFGKSLLISTLKELFSGNRALFKGLWIDSSDYQWAQHPVIHLDFATIAHNTPQDMEASLSWRLHSIAQDYGITITKTAGVYDQLSDLVKQLAHKNKVVILIDEYDKPILDHISDVPKAHLMKDAIRGMYDVIKGLDEHLRAIFVTGVTKFAKTSVFSGMNNLNDISFSEVSAALLGYTQEEVIHYFPEYIQAVADKEHASYDEILATMKLWYNGYRFSESLVKVYNPFSLHYYLSKQKLANYWFQSGTPTFLIHLLKRQYHDIENISNAEIKLEHLGMFELEDIPLIPLLFQTGYLTVADYNHKTNKLTLGYPNYEVEESFTKYIVAALSHTTAVVVDNSSSQLIRALNNNDLEKFCSTLQSLLARIPYTLRINKESYYHSLFQFLMSLLIFEAQSEVITNRGRIDTAIEMDKYIYVFELKVNKDPQEALQQILDTKYYERYTMTGKKIVLVGLVFNTPDQEFSVTYISQQITA